MDINLILSAQTLRLAPQLRQSELINGLYVLKNVPARTYLRVTPEQWLILQQFSTPKMVPAVLGYAIRERVCLPLGEFYELILKALRAGILLEPGIGPDPVAAYEWTWKMRPVVLGKWLSVIFSFGLLFAIVVPPKMPASILDILVGLVILSATLSFGEFLAACMIRGAGGEVYRPRWNWRAVPPHFFVDADDSIMQPIDTQALIAVAMPATLAGAVGIATLNRPEWAFFPLIGLIFALRPIFGYGLASIIHAGKERGPSDAEHDYIFAPNKRPEARSKLMRRALSLPTIWVRIAYGVVWAFAILYWVSRLRTLPPWTFEFWRNNWIRVAIGIGGSFAVLAACYFFWEMFHWMRERGRARRNTLRLWRIRWFSTSQARPDESGRLKMLTTSPLFSTLQPPQRLDLARSMATRRFGPWKALPEYGGEPTAVAMVASGKISLRRELPTGRTVQVQVLSEGDIIGLHDLADPKFPRYHVRTLTPVTLLSMDRPMAEKLIIGRVSQAVLTDSVLKLPFLRRISLCQNWHLQAINRFARLSSIVSFAPDKAILCEGQTVEEFYVIFQGNAKVSRDGRTLATISAGEFFGEIGLMQNSSPNATVTAHQGTRCLGIARTELLRFVTHNYSVALEIERVSSERLGRPLFPLRVGDFRSI